MVGWRACFYAKWHRRVLCARAHNSHPSPQPSTLPFHPVQQTNYIHSPNTHWIPDSEQQVSFKGTSFAFIPSLTIVKSISCYWSSQFRRQKLVTLMPTRLRGTRWGGAAAGPRNSQLMAARWKLCAAGREEQRYCDIISSLQQLDLKKMSDCKKNSENN